MMPDLFAAAPDAAPAAAQHAAPAPVATVTPPSGPDFWHVKGQEAAKRALEIALAGNHHILLTGPSGCGKTMLATAAHTLQASFKQCDDIDELPLGRFDLDSNVAVVATATNLAAIPFTILDRFHIVAELVGVSAADLLLPAPAETNAEIAKRLAATEAAQMPSVAIPAQGVALLRDAAEAMKLTARAFQQVLAVAATIARMDQTDSIGRIHLAEALSYRHRHTTASE